MEPLLVRHSSTTYFSPTICCLISFLQDQGDHIQGAAVADQDDDPAEQRQGVRQEHHGHPQLGQGEGGGPLRKACSSGGGAGQPAGPGGGAEGAPARLQQVTRQL